MTFEWFDGSFYSLELALLTYEEKLELRNLMKEINEKYGYGKWTVKKGLWIMNEKPFYHNLDWHLRFAHLINTIEERLEKVKFDTEMEEGSRYKSHYKNSDYDR